MTVFLFALPLIATTCLVRSKLLFAITSGFAFFVFLAILALDGTTVGTLLLSLTCFNLAILCVSVIRFRGVVFFQPQ